jgi:hypothetical protein
MDIHKFIGECNEEYRQHLNRDSENGNGNLTSAFTTSKASLLNQIGKKSNSQAQPQKPNAQRSSNAQGTQNPKHPQCTHCGRTNHKIDDCYHIAKPKCSSCNKLGHKADDCRNKKKNTRRQQKHDLVADATKNEALGRHNKRTV